MKIGKQELNEFDIKFPRERKRDRLKSRLWENQLLKELSKSLGYPAVYSTSNQVRSFTLAQHTPGTLASTVPHYSNIHKCIYAWIIYDGE